MGALTSRILAFDLGKAAGWATYDGARLSAGTINSEHSSRAESRQSEMRQGEIQAWSIQMSRRSNRQSS